MNVLCDWCGIEFSISPYKLKTQSNKFCSRECYWAYKGRNKVKTQCFNCGKKLLLSPSLVRQRNFCSHRCVTITRNREDNPMNSLEARSKSTLTRLNGGDGKTYPKLKGRHVHRTVAEMLLGRKLLSGEIVHHIDNDKRNFSINNLKVFRSQAEHAAYHQALQKGMGSK